MSKSLASKDNLARDPVSITNSKNNSKDICPICLGLLRNKWKICCNNGSQLVTTRCNHQFHWKCLSEWFMRCTKETTCPICRTEFPLADNTK